MIKQAEQLRREVVAKLQGGEGQVHMTHLQEEKVSPGKVKLYAKCVIPPGASIGRHQHVGTSETYYILAGEATVEDNGVKAVLRPGDMIFTDDGDFHSIQSSGGTDLEYITLILYK